MGAAHIPDDIRGKVGSEAIKCATQRNGLRVIKVQDKIGTWYFHVFKLNPNWAVKLWTWGEAGVVSEGPDGESGNHGIKSLFVCYLANRESDSVWIYDPTTNEVVTTHDVIWMKHMYYTWPKDAVFCIKSTPLDTDAKDVEDVIETNDDSEIEAVKENEI